MHFLQRPHILDKGQVGKNVNVCIKDLLFKIKEGRNSPTCELWHNDGKIEANDDRYRVEYKKDNNVFELSILHFERQLKGAYECVVSTVDEPKISTAIEVIIDCGMFAYRHVMHAVVRLTINIGGGSRGGTRGTHPSPPSRAMFIANYCRSLCLSYMMLQFAKQFRPCLL